MYDVIIVGARVAGASTAMLLARRGLKVLVVDRATFPSDTLSTHQVQLPGVARLARWGVLDAVLAAGTPATRDVRFDQGDAVITGRFPAYQGVEAMCSPRRTLLDRVLVDAARAAGAEVRENFTVEEILGDGQVTGIRGREKGAPAVTEQARLVIGADGKHSLVAKAVGARAYRTRPPRSMAFYTYWADVPARTAARPGRRDLRPAGLRRRRLADQRRPADDLPGLAGGPVRGVPPRRRGQLPAHARRRRAWASGSGPAAGRSGSAAPRTCPATSASRTVPAGPWSATPACCSTRSPARASATPSATRNCWPTRSPTGSAASARWPRRSRRYHRARDRAARPMYDFTARLAAVNPPAPAEMALFRALARRQEDADMFVGALAGRSRCASSCRRAPWCA